MSKRILLAALAVLLLAWGCTEQRPNRSFVQELALRKDAFKGTWYYSLTAVESSYEAAWVFPGKQDLALNKVRWKIEKDYLYAYRTHAITRGADRDLAYRTEEQIGEPVAAFRIASHFDIRHSYNPVNGEEYNVLEENTTDRLWYDRDYMRVDWSKNLINNFSYVRGDLEKLWNSSPPETQPVDFFVEDANSPFAPKFNDDDGDGVFDYIDVIHQVTVDPSGYEVYTIEQLQPQQMTLRNSFLRVREDHSYEPLYFPDSKFERFGYFRNERGTYERYRGETDFLDYFANRYNIWQQVHSDVECDSHDDCTVVGSKCDLYNDLCTLPYTEREEKPIVYYLTANFPDLFRDQVPLISDGWNRTFQAAVNDLKYDGARKLACVGDEAAADQAGCCTVEQRAAGDDTCVPDMYVIRDNSCTTAGVREYLQRNGDFWGDVEPYTESGEINRGNLVAVCAALEAATHRAETDEPFSWEQLGDLRYSFVSWVDNASTASPLGYGPLNGDPETGETINGNANIYGAAIDTYRSFISDWYDLIDGVVDPDRFANGEHVREYFQNLGEATGQPTVPEVFLPNPIDLDPAKLQVAVRDMRERFEPRLDELQKQSSWGSNVQKLAGTYIEDMLLNDEVMLANGIPPGTELTEELKDRISPVRATKGALRGRGSVWQRELESQNIFTLEAAMDVSVEHLIEEARRTHGLDHCRGAHWTDHDANGDERLDDDERASLETAVADYRSRPECRDWALDWIMKRVFRGVTEHEIGHTIGLRHNFEASFDEEGYAPKYWELKSKLPDIELGEFDADGDAKLDRDEYREYLAASDGLKRQRELSGLDQYMYSSIMDYGGQFYSDFAGVGKWDAAAIKFGYGELREVYDGEPNARRDNRLNVPHWDGGEICIQHADCPMHVPAKFSAYQEGQPTSVQGLTQTCGMKRRTEGREEWLPVGEDVAGKGFCSNFDDDLGRTQFSAPRHNFCSDERAEDRAHCNRFDEGRSSVEIVENMIETYERRYLFNNFRRYRRWFPFDPSYYSYLDRYFAVIGKQFQAMIWRIFYQEGFSTDAGPGGFRDMFSASVAGMNFFSNVLTRPSIGPYRWDDEEGLLLRCGRADAVGVCWDDSASQYDVNLGNGGKYSWTAYEQGYYGAISRVSQMGTFVDKIKALESLTTRTWSTAGGNDESIPFNYYDAFGDSMLDLFSGVITANHERFAPVAIFNDDDLVDHIEYRDFWYGTFQGRDVDSQRLRGFDDQNLTPTERYGNARLMDAGLSVIHQIYALIYSLSDFSSFFDATYSDYAQLLVYNSTWEPEEAWEAPNPVIEYRSPLRGKIFKAVQTDDGMSIAADLVARAAETKERWDRAPEGTDEKEQARRELADLESFLNIAADIIGILGIGWQ